MLKQHHRIVDNTSTVRRLVVKTATKAGLEGIFVNHAAVRRSIRLVVKTTTKAGLAGVFVNHAVRRLAVRSTIAADISTNHSAPRLIVG